MQGFMAERNKIPQTLANYEDNRGEYVPSQRKGFAANISNPRDVPARINSRRKLPFSLPKLLLHTG
jgi:hypothetical protein